MRAIRATRPRPKVDPAPSRWAWRLERLMLTPAFRIACRVILPFVVVAGCAGWWFSVERNRMMIVDFVATVRADIEDRPEFRVNMMAIDGANDALARDIRETIALDFPLSSFDLDLEQIRQKVLEMPPVKDVAMRVRSGGVLQVDVTPRVPVVVWRTVDGFAALDADGQFVASTTDRANYRHLPLLAGIGADQHVEEAIALYRVGLPLGARMRGVLRVGNRRWDVLLDRDQRILLPEAEPVSALERVIALEQTQGLLRRDVTHVDMRLGQRPTLRLSPAATETYWNTGPDPLRTSNDQ